MSESLGRGDSSIPQHNPFEGMGQEEVDAYLARLNEAEEQRRIQALERLPDFPEEDKELLVIGVYTFVSGLIRKGQNSLHSMVLGEVLKDLRYGHPDILSFEKTKEIYDKFQQPE